MDNAVTAGLSRPLPAYNPHYSRVRPSIVRQSPAPEASGADSPSARVQPRASQTPTPSSAPPGDSGATAARRSSEARSPGSESAPRPETSADPSGQSRPQPSRSSGMTRAELQTIRQLQQRANEVRAHEQAHIAAGGRFVQGGASFSYRMGPDGRMYAVGGEVSIDTSPVPGDPQATLEKARQIRRAALAPAEPSAQDLQAAAKAAQMAAEARAKLRQEESSSTAPSGKTQAEQSGSNRGSNREGAGAFEGSKADVLHTPPPKVVQRAYLQQSERQAPLGLTMGHRFHHRA